MDPIAGLIIAPMITGYLLLRYRDAHTVRRPMNSGETVLLCYLLGFVPAVLLAFLVRISSADAPFVDTLLFTIPFSYILGCVLNSLQLAMVRSSFKNNQTPMHVQLRNGEHYEGSALDFSLREEKGGRGKPYLVLVSVKRTINGVTEELDPQTRLMVRTSEIVTLEVTSR